MIKQETASHRNTFSPFIATLANWIEGPKEKVSYRKLRAIDDNTLRDVGLDRWQILLPPK